MSDISDLARTEPHPMWTNRVATSGALMTDGLRSILDLMQRIRDTPPVYESPVVIIAKSTWDWWERYRLWLAKRLASSWYKPRRYEKSDYMDWPRVGKNGNPKPRFFRKLRLRSRRLRLK